MESHLNRENKPLCGKSTWIEAGDNLVSKDVKCEVCEKIMKKEAWATKTPEQKKRTYLYHMQELMKVWGDEMQELVENGEDIHEWANFVKTESFIKKSTNLSNIPYLKSYLNILQYVIDKVSCQHSNVKTDTDKEKEICLDCGWERIWWWQEVGEDDGLGRETEKRYSRWEEDRRTRE